MTGLTVRLPPSSVTANTLPTPNQEPTNNVPLSPRAICRAAGTRAHNSILNPGGNLICLSVASTSASVKPVGGGSVLSTCVPFCSLVSSPMNQSSGGWVQNSFLLES
jgi:hypothetical protein